ncbi:MAG: helix-turn-helix transcriptional regulator [Kofleriaceae bacterium]
MWLRAGRAQRNLTLDDVARVTKIQPRILQKIEAGNLEGLPAEVFVRGFIKSFARAVGLSETEAVERYGQAAAAVKLGGTSSVARAFVETLVAAPVSMSVTKAGAPTLLQAPVVPPLPEILPEASMELEPIKLEEPSIEIAIETVSEPIAATTSSSTSTSTTTQTTVVESKIEVVEAAPAEVVEAAPTKKKRSRKKAAAGTTPPRSQRKKKNAVVGLEAAPTSGIVADAVAVAVNDHAVSEPAIVMSTEPALATEIAAEIAAPAIEEKAIEVIDHTASPSGAAASPGEARLVDASNAADDLFAPADGIVIDQDLAEGSEPHVSGPVEKIEPEVVADAGDDVVTSAPIDIWKPTMPPVAPSVPWKRPTSSQKVVPAYTMPSLVIDDADPDTADRQRDDREQSKGPHRVSFLPPILLDREDKSTRQGGLTLAVILLLIAATLTLSYLMRRPSVSGDGVTNVELVDRAPIA